MELKLVSGNSRPFVTEAERELEIAGFPGGWVVHREHAPDAEEANDGVFARIRRESYPSAAKAPR